MLFHVVVSCFGSGEGGDSGNGCFFFFFLRKAERHRRGVGGTAKRAGDDSGCAPHTTCHLATRCQSKRHSQTELSCLDRIH